MRNWLNAARSYIEPVEIGATMRALGIGRVLDSKDPKFKKGDLVCSSILLSSIFAFTISYTDMPYRVIYALNMTGCMKSLTPCQHHRIVSTVLTIGIWDSGLADVLLRTR